MVIIYLLKDVILYEIIYMLGNLIDIFSKIMYFLISQRYSSVDFYYNNIFDK